MKNLSEYIFHHAAEKPDSPFILHGDYEITFRKAAEQISAISRELLDIGLKPGQTVGILMQNCPEFILCYLAVLNVGGLASLLPWSMPEGEVATLATTTRIDTLFYSMEFQEHTNQILNLSNHPIKCYVHGRKTDADAINIYDLINHRKSDESAGVLTSRVNAVILFSAGDYSHPKSLVFTHENLIETALSISEKFPKNYQARIYTSLPFFHYYPFTLVLNLAIVRGNTIIIPIDSSRTKLFESIEKQRVNIFIGNSGFIEELVSEPDFDSEQVHSIDYFIPLGNSITMETKNIIFDRYHTQIIEAYGVAEAPVISMNYNSSSNHDASVGKPLSCCEIKIVAENGNHVRKNEPGFLRVRGKNVFHHYFDKYPIIERTPEEWVDTGDVALLNEEGYLFWLCKQSDWILRSGFRVNPAEILTVVQKYPAVKEATILIKKQNFDNDHVKLVVTVNDPEKFNTQELMDHCTKYLPKYMVPDSVGVVDHFDRNCIGIIKKSNISFEE